MASDDNELVNQIANSNNAQKKVFVFMCAERARSIVSVFGSERARSDVDAIMDSVWQFQVAGFDATAAEQSIRHLPDAMVDDSNNPSYYAMRALGIIVDAIHATEFVDAALVGSVISGMRDLAGDIGFHLSQVTSYDGRLDEFEAEAERESADALNSVDVGEVDAATASFRDVARRQATTLAKAAEALAMIWAG